ncbi:MAG: ABC transporter permease [Bryobacteraceae bacterium]
MILPDTVLQDLRYGARMLYRGAGFTLVAVLALAVGIGVNTAAFTAYKAMVERPLDARDPGQMVNLALIRHLGAIDPMFSVPDYQSYRERLHSFSGVIAQSVQHLALSNAGNIVSERNSTDRSLFGRLGLIPPGASNVEFAGTFIVSENYFAVLGVKPLRGRSFDSIGTAELAAAPSVLISENYWRSRFAADPALLGRTIRLNGAAFTIVGITPHDFVGGNVFVPDFWLPLSLEPLLHANDSWLSERENECCRLFGRLAPGVSQRQAQAEVTLVANRLRTLHDPHSELAKPVTSLVWRGSPFPLPLKEYGGMRFAILLIMSAVGMVLAVACANVASLQLARTASRQSELGMRLSLGASRLRIIRQLLTESALLGLLAGALALPLSWGLTSLLANEYVNALPADLGTVVFHVTPDAGIFLYVLAISLAAGVLFGLTPALESSRSALAAAFKAKGGTSPGSGRRMRDLLITIQVAVSLVLMIAGSMFIHSAVHLRKEDPGYDSKHVVDVDVQFPEWSKYAAIRKSDVIDRLRSRLAAVPGVTEITSARTPDDDLFFTAAVPLNNEKTSAERRQSVLHYRYVQSNYFETLGIPLSLGRSFRSQPGYVENAVILSESAAKQLWPGQNPLGRRVRLGAADEKYQSQLIADGRVYQVVGVSRDTRGLDLDGGDSKQIYLPLPNDRLQDRPILIRTESNPAQVINALGRTVASIDPNLMVSFSTLEEMLRRNPSFVMSSLAAAFVSAVGLIGLLLALMGIHGMVSYIVVLRTREVGIRMAIGAQRRDILALMLRESTRPVIVGLIFGAILAVGASYLLRSVFYRLDTFDGVSFVGMAVLFCFVALLAAYAPSRRAMRVEPMTALRYE